MDLTYLYYYNITNTQFQKHENSRATIVTSYFIDYKI